MDQLQHHPVRALIRPAVLCGICLGMWLVVEPAPSVLAASTAKAQQSAQADLKIVIQTLKQHFASLPNYQPGDLLTQTQVAEVLRKLEDAGLKVADAERITKLALADDSFLAKEFSTPAGRAFMRKIARLPGGYSQVDRLSSISRGRTIVRDLIRQRGGDEFMEYLTTTKGGRNLGNMLAGAQQGVDLNKPTGRIYTANDLVAELGQVLEKQPQK